MKLLDAPLGAPAGVRAVGVQRWPAGADPTEAHDHVAEEVPVALEYNGISHAVMLASPADLEDFALGFSLTEEIVDSVGDLRDLEVVRSGLGLTVRLEVASACFHRLKERRRSLAGRTGCGLCGTESLQHAVRMPGAVTGTATTTDTAALARAMDGLRRLQQLHAATGATHAAGLADADGALRLVREDVGRHNALDKLVGAMARDGSLTPGAGMVVVTSRASYEMVGKTARAGIGLLAAVSGVTGLAVDVAEAAALTLVGFTRAGQCSVYTHPQRVRRSEHGS